MVDLFLIDINRFEKMDFGLVESCDEVVELHRRFIVTAVFQNTRGVKLVVKDIHMETEWAIFQVGPDPLGQVRCCLVTALVSLRNQRRREDTRVTVD